MEHWRLPWAGGCRCGQTRIQVTAPPLLASACHCTGCQRMTASAFSLSLAVLAQGLAITAGEPVIGGRHGATCHSFCPRCKSWMFTKPEGLDDIVNVRAMMLDDHTWFRPFVEFWTEFEEFSGLIEDYAARGARPG
jgi:hypothetical protein